MRPRGFDALERLFPPRPGADETRHRYAVVALVLAVVLAISTAPPFLLYDRTLAAITAGFGALALALLVAVRRGASARVAFWLLQVQTSLLMLFGRWTELEFDATWVMWLGVLPVTGAAFAGARGAVRGLLLGVVFSGVMLLVPAPSFFEPVPVRMVGVVVRTVSFLAAMFFLSLTWNTLRDDALARAETAASARKLFLAKMSHELRTPMNGVLGLTDVLLGNAPRPDQRASLELMRRSGEHLLALINDAIDFARLDSGQLPLVDEAVDLHALLTDSGELLRPVAEPKGLRISTRFAPGAPRWVRGDALRVQQVLINLVGNAVKFTERGHVEIALEPRGESYALVISDTGVGVEASVRDRLFQAFEQGSRRLGGSGLGLAISRRLVERMGGALDFQSTEGKGSVFTAVLPCRPVAPPPAPVMPRGVPAAGGQAPRVLLVDDNEINLRVATALVEKAGYVATPVSCGTQALAALQEQAFAAVLLDCQMPDPDGFATARAIRAMPGERGRVPIIALTASVFPEEVDRCRDAGMDGWLAKPVTLPALAEALGRAVPRRLEGAPAGA